MTESDLISRAKVAETIRALHINFGGRDMFPDEVKGAVLHMIGLIPSVATEPRWISVEERLPEDCGERVLVRLNDDCIVGHPRMDTDRLNRGMWVRYGDNVTHWMPLPEPPKDGGDEG